MNQTLNTNTINLNDTEFIREIFLKVIGSSWLYDSLYLFLIVPMGVFGTILNVISLVIFSRKEFIRVLLFQYFRIYTFISLVLSGTLSCAFFMSPRHLFNLSTSYSARIYKCLILPSYILPLFLLFSNSMGILVNLERASNFSNRFLRFKNTSPYLTSSILFIICVIVNLPTHFLVTPASDQEVRDAQLSYENVIKFRGVCLRNPISLTIWGRVISIFGFAIKGVLVLILDISSNLASAYYLRKYHVKKIELTNNTDTNVTKSAKKKEKEEKREKVRLNHTYMTIYLTLFAILMHLVIFSADLVIFFFSTNASVLFAFTFLTFFVAAFKQIVNFLFFYFFNRKFRQCLKKTAHFEFSTHLNSSN